jgi:hypothetical protein
LLAWLLLPVPEAAAQFGRTPGSRLPRPQEEAARPPPPALPGLQYRKAPEAIPADPNVVLSPTEGLFDAINRGDIRAARDAVNRGADLDARNVLGLRAEEAAVDQNRSDILFFLLSVRGGVRPATQGPDATQAAAAAAARPARPPRGSRQARNPDEPTPAGPPADRAMPKVVEKAPRNPRLWAGGGGTAQPDAGFLGFDAGRPAGGAPAAEGTTRSRGAGG